MIFRPELARKILRGEKTMTRRPVRPDETRCRYLPEHLYAIQPGRGKAAIGLLRVVDVVSEQAGAITFSDARAEGFRTTDEFRAYWTRLYEPNWPHVERVFCLCTDPDQPTDELPTCELCGGTETIRIKPWPTDAELVARFEARHADTMVWAIRFALERDEPRFLAARSDELYTRNAAQALRDEPEAVDVLTQARFTKEGREKPRITEREVWLDERAQLEAVLARLRARIVNRSAEKSIAAIERQVRSLDRKLAA